MSKTRFENLLVEAVDEALSSLGESSKQAVYFHLRKSFNVEKKEVPFRIKAFSDGIEKIFGPGADFLEVLIIKRLHEKTGTVRDELESTDLNLPERVAMAKLDFVSKRKTDVVIEGSARLDSKEVRKHE